MSFAAIAIGVGMVATAGVALYEGNKQNQVANTQIGLEQQQMGKQNVAFNQLQQLLGDPGSFFSSPVYKAAASQGSSAVARENAAQFGPNSGNEAQALQAYGQSFGQQQLLSQEQLLAGMSGTGFNPAGAGQAASGALSAGGNALGSLGGLLAFFGTSGAVTGSTAAAGGDTLASDFAMGLA